MKDKRMCAEKPEREPQYRRIRGDYRCYHCALSVFVKGRDPEICWGLSRQGVTTVAGGGGRSCRSFIEASYAELDRLRALHGSPVREEVAGEAKDLIKVRRYVFDGKVYRCSRCAYACTHRDTMKKHFMRKHDERPARAIETELPGESSQPDRKIQDSEPWAE